MCFQTDDSLRTDCCIMDGARGQVEPVTGFQCELTPKFGQSKRDSSLHNIDDFVIGMRMCGIHIMRSIRP